MIYLDYNATTPLHPRVFEAMVPYFREYWGNPSSSYRFGNEARVALELARKRIGEAFGCNGSEIIFCGSGTESDNLAIRGVAHALKSRGNHIITTTIEHPAVLNTCKSLEKEGYRVTYLPTNRGGVIELKTLEASITKETILVSVMHANNETGVIQPVKELSAIARSRGIVFHTDAVQTAGKISFSINDVGADLMSFSAHKMHGPKGIAALYVRKGTPLSSMILGGGQERGFRAGTENVAGIVGFSEAVSLANDTIAAEFQRVQKLRNYFETKISTLITGVRINGVDSLRVPNTSNLSFQAVDGESIVLGMDLRGFCLSTGSACSTGAPEPSHVLLAMGLAAQDAQGSIRLSIGSEINEDHLHSAAIALAEVVTKLRSISSL